MPTPLVLTGNADGSDAQTWHFSVSNAAGGTLTLYYGDGHNDAVPAALSLAFNHRYSTPGNYAVVAHMSAGGQADVTLDITVAESSLVPGQVVTFEDYRPPPRYDHLPWTDVRIWESPDGLDPWTQIDVVTLTPLDADPSQPMLRAFTTEYGTALGYWYRVVFGDATGDVSQPTIPVQNTGVPAAVVNAYASVDELFRVLKVRNPTQAQFTAGQRVLDAAALEIDSELGLQAPYADPPALVVEVNLERAVEHWQQEEVPYGIWENPTGSIIVGRNTWERHALKLAPLKQTWGLG